MHPSHMRSSFVAVHFAPHYRHAVHGQIANQQSHRRRMTAALLALQDRLVGDDDAMEPRQFVAATITQIVQGVVDAQAAVAQLGATVNPSGISRHGAAPAAHYVGPDNVPVQPVTFDIAVTLDKTDSKKGRIGVASVIRAGVEGGIDTRNQVANRITFAVPVLLPGHAVPKGGEH